MIKPRATCANCLIEPYDAGPCPDCDSECVRCRRVATGCLCTCVNINMLSCPGVESISNCGCPDGTKEAGVIINFVYLAFTVPDEVVNVATKRCPDGPKFKLRFWGSHYDFATHTTTTDLNCPVSTIAWDAVPFVGGTELTDPTGGGFTVEGAGCTAGAVAITAEQMGIVTTNPAGAPGDSTPCYQEGGHVAMLAEFRSYCDDKLIVLCPFPGVVGAESLCGIPPGFCEDWVLETAQDGCDVTLTFTHVAGECGVTVTVTIGGGTPFVLNIADGDPQVFTTTIDPCEPGATRDVTVQKAWDPTCLHECKVHDTTDTLTFTA